MLVLMLQPLCDLPAVPESLLDDYCGWLVAMPTDNPLSLL
jgi:hypothetical protein